MDNQELNDLFRQIKKVKNAYTAKQQSSKKPLLDPWVIVIEFVSGAIVGLIIGRFFDKVFDSHPLFFIIFLLIGTIASIRSILQKFGN